MPPAPRDQTSRDTALVNAGIVLSRVVGLVRQRVLAHYLGTSAAADAVLAAFRIGNVTQNLLGEGALSASFVPVYLRLRIEGQGAHARFARATLGWLFLLVALISVLGALFAPTLAMLIAPGFDGARFELTTRALRVLFPMTGVLVLGAWSLAILSAHRRFLLGYMAPVAWSVAQIVAVLVAGIGLHKRGSDIAIVVAWGALGGAITQLLVMVVPVRKLIGGLRPTFEIGAPGVREAMSKFPSAVFGRGVILISGLLDTVLVSFLGPGAISSFAYAQTIYLLPMAVLGPGEAAVSLVDFSEKRATLGQDEAKQAIIASLARTLSRVFALALAATVAFVTLGPEIVAMLFQGGKFDADSTQAVAIVLAAYGPGLPANAASRLFGTACFALGDTRRPALFAAVRVVTSTCVSLVLMRHLGVAGVVIGAAFAAWVELSLLVYTVKKELGATGLMVVRYTPMIVSAIALGAVGLGTRYALARLGVPTLIAAISVVGLAGVAFLFVADRTGALSVRSLLSRRRS